MSGGTPPPRPLGRNTQATMDAWRQIAGELPLCGTSHLFKGYALPKRSLNLRAYRNPRRDTFHQIIGMCGGAGFSSMLETSARTPDPLDGESMPPGDGEASPAFSGLWCYGLARDESRRRGIEMGPEEGCILSHALLGAEREGVAMLASWDDGEAEQARCVGPLIDSEFARRSRLIPMAQRARLRAGASRLDSWSGMLRALGSGWTVAVGIQWPWSALDTDAAARFRWDLRSGYVGGHVVEFVDYDLQARRAWIRNSWPGWGIRGVGWTDLESFAASFTERAMRSGQSEAVLVAETTERGGLRPKVDWAEVWG